MQKLLDLHQRLGRLGLRLLFLQLLWLGYTLRGAVVLGIFPATAAVHAVLRQQERDGDDDELPRWRPLRTAFAEHWRRELWPANRLGLLLSLMWSVLLASRAVVERVDLGAPGPLLAGGHTILGVLLGLVTMLAWPLQAHFDDGAPALLRRALVLVLGRPAISLLAGAGVGLVLCAYYLLPGLVPVFGVPATAAIATACLWRTGVLMARAPSPRLGGPAPAAVPHRAQA
ncbi:YesL family protein [Pseudactinotalea terrae]|uniref:YesL family protein n=1 Tax=Pseudactinotalea terrae TaxID=1743262 RepID=UPI0012E0F64C|nr:DUF624 domain-containing protein [Pseudactinotalea terrae]